MHPSDISWNQNLQDNFMTRNYTQSWHLNEIIWQQNNPFSKTQDASFRGVPSRIFSRILNPKLQIAKFLNLSLFNLEKLQMQRSLPRNFQILNPKLHLQFWRFRISELDLLRGHYREFLQSEINFEVFILNMQHECILEWKSETSQQLFLFIETLKMSTCQDAIRRRRAIHSGMATSAAASLGVAGSTPLAQCSLEPQLSKTSRNFSIFFEMVV